MKKVFLFAVFAVLVFVPSFAVTVTFWEALSGSRGEALNRIVREFNESHSDIYVKTVYVGNRNSLGEKLLAASASGNLPTMSQTFSDWSARLIKSGVVKPMQDFIDMPGRGLTKAQTGDLWGNVVKACTWNGKIYTLPFYESMYVLYVNKDAFMAAGLDMPKTMPELFKDAKILTLKKGSKTVMYGLGIESAADTFEAFLRQNGGRVLSEGYTRASLESTPAERTLKTLVGAVKEGCAYVRDGGLGSAFGDEKIAMYVGTTADMPYVKSAAAGKFAWTAVPLPGWWTDAPPLTGADVAIFGTSSAAGQEGAWEFVKFLLTPQIQSFWAVNTGYFPMVKGALTTDAWQNYIGENPVMGRLVTKITDGSFDPPIAKWDRIGKILGDEVSDALYMKKSPKTALERAQKEIDALLGK